MNENALSSSFIGNTPLVQDNQDSAFEVKEEIATLTVETDQLVTTATIKSPALSVTLGSEEYLLDLHSNAFQVWNQTCVNQNNSQCSETPTLMNTAYTLTTENLNPFFDLDSTAYTTSGVIYPNQIVEFFGIDRIADLHVVNTVSQDKMRYG